MIWIRAIIGFCAQNFGDQIFRVFNEPNTILLFRTPSLLDPVLCRNSISDNNSSS